MIFGLAKTKKNIILLVVLALSIMTIAVSFAFFAVEVADSVTTNLGATSETVERLTFTQSDETLSIHATQENFGSGDGNLSVTTTSSATLIASESLGSASRTYNAYVNVARNNYVYTQPSNKPELVLTIIKPDGTELENIDGFTHVTVIDAITEETVSGFDITTYEGLIKIQEDIAISTSDSSVGITQDWIVTLTFINLIENQYENGGKELVADFILQEEEAGISLYCSNKNVNECLVNSYDLILNDPGNTSEMSQLMQGFIKHTPELANSAGDNNYRYAGSNEIVSNNWVCFGSDVTPCPQENKYRILGSYDGNVKLIKATAVDKDGDGILEIALRDTDGNDHTDVYESGEDGVVYDASKNNDYASSDLKTYLNNDVYNSFSNFYKSMIKTSDWYVGGNNDNGVTAYTFYKNGIENPIVSKVSTENIGIMYASDYGFAASKELWNRKLSEYTPDVIGDNNWLLNLNEYEAEWLIDPYVGYSMYSWIIHFVGLVASLTTDYGLGVRPVFYLDSNVEIQNGDGSESSPFYLGNL